MLHLKHTSDQGHSKAYIRTVDTDVVVLTISHFHDMSLSELWVGLGSRKTFREIPIHVITEQLGTQRCQALPLFHAYTGCDMTSSMFGIGKKTAWTAWNAFPDATDTFVALTQDPISLTIYSEHMACLERLTVLMYSKNCGSSSVNEARKRLFTHGPKSLDSIPPTQHALFQHTKRALLIAAFTWKQSLPKDPELPDPTSWGWRNDRTKAWVPHWTDLPDASRGCCLLLHCGCTIACRGNCKCHRAGIRCSIFCKCEGGCTNNDADNWLWHRHHNWIKVIILHKTVNNSIVIWGMSWYIFGEIFNICNLYHEIAGNRSVCHCGIFCYSEKIWV